MQTVKHDIFYGDGRRKKKTGKLSPAAITPLKEVIACGIKELEYLAVLPSELSSFRFVESVDLQNLVSVGV